MRPEVRPARRTGRETRRAVAAAGPTCDLSYDLRYTLRASRQRGDGHLAASSTAGSATHDLDHRKRDSRYLSRSRSRSEDFSRFFEPGIGSCTGRPWDHPQHCDLGLGPKPGPHRELNRDRTAILASPPPGQRRSDRARAPGPIPTRSAPRRSRGSRRPPEHDLHRVTDSLAAEQDTQRDSEQDRERGSEGEREHSDQQPVVSSGAIPSALHQLEARRHALRAARSTVKPQVRSLS
jgi:hypothetical protein